MRRSPKVTEGLPILYLRELSTSDFRPALEELLGEDVAGLSPTQHRAAYRRLGKRIYRLSPARPERREYVYVWVDGPTSASVWVTIGSAPW